MMAERIPHGKDLFVAQQQSESLLLQERRAEIVG